MILSIVYLCVSLFIFMSVLGISMFFIFVGLGGDLVGDKWCYIFVLIRNFGVIGEGEFFFLYVLLDFWDVVFWRGVDVVL